MGVWRPLGRAARGLSKLFSEDPDKDNATLRAVEETALRGWEMRRLREELSQAGKKAENAQKELARRVKEMQEVKERAERDMEDARRRTVEAEEREKLAREQARRAEKETEQARARLKEVEDIEAEMAVKWGIAPVKWPTREEIATARENIEYNPKLLHFAVCGLSGGGKSSLINALQGVTDKDPRAARVGVTETTTKVTRFADKRLELPFARFVWYDVPGAGTLGVPHWQYFIDQGLFVFDFIIMVYGGRFTEIDARILENCRRFKIPVFVVRSKADQEIKNMAVSDGYEEDEEDYKPWHEKKKPIYIEQARTNFNEELRKIVSSQRIADKDLLKEPLYIISSRTLRPVITPGDSEQQAKIQNKIIDEEALIDDMLKVAAYRRYETRAGAAMDSGTGRNGEAPTGKKCQRTLNMSEQGMQ